MDTSEVLLVELEAVSPSPNLEPDPAVVPPLQRRSRLRMYRNCYRCRSARSTANANGI
jgi:hypothetical protein